MTDTGAGNRELRIEYLRLDQIRRDPGNSKDHDLGALAESLERFGFVAPMGMNERTGLLLFGHGRLDDLEDLMPRTDPPPDGIKIDPADGMWMAPVVRGISLSEEDGKAYTVADNRLVELGGWREPELARRLTEIVGASGLSGLSGTGFDSEDLDSLVRILSEGHGAEGQDADDEPDQRKAINKNRVWCPACGASFLLPQRGNLRP